MSWFLVLLLLAFASVLCALLGLWITKFHKKLQVFNKLPGFRPHYLIGNLYSFGALKWKERKRLVSEIFNIRLGISSVFHKEGLYVAWMGPLPIVLITRAKTAEVLLTSQVLIDKSRLYDALSDSLGEGLLTSSGDRWRHDRKVLTPAFHFRVLEESLDMMNSHAKVLVEVLKRKSEGNRCLDPQDAMNNCVLDILLDFSLGTHVQAQTQSSELVEIVERVAEMIIDRIYSPWFHSDIYYLFPKGRKFQKLNKHAENVMDKIIDKRISEIKESEKKMAAPKRKIFLDILLEQGISKKELRDQINTFLVAGHHTVGSSLCWVLYLLGLYKDVQSKLFDEVNGVFRGGEFDKVTNDNLKELKYMDCVIKEGHRLYPSISDMGRKLSEDAVIGGYKIPKGTDCFMMIMAIHRDPDFYPDPERFDPDRFLLENFSGKSQFAHIPFSSGPRNCIGQRYAHMKMKVILCHIISKLSVHSLDPQDKIIVYPDVVSKPLDHFRILFEPRLQNA